MLLSPDFRELLSILGKYRVRYLVIGGYAVMRYTEPRFTKDLDLWISTERENAEAVFNALKDFGAPLKNLSADDFTKKDYFYQMGRPPFRLDVMMSVPGIEFETAWANKEVMVIEGLSIPFISKADLISSKKACGRLEDLLDVRNLEKSEPPESATR